VIGKIDSRVQISLKDARAMIFGANALLKTLYTMLEELSLVWNKKLE
jgi:hypothetical protein